MISMYRFFHGSIIFLTDRTQVVKYENYISNRIDVVSGVTQGYHLSPLLSSLFINDMIS